jgi:hypothetical protein
MCLALRCRFNPYSLFSNENSFHSCDGNSPTNESLGRQKRLNQHLKPIKVLGVRFIQSCFYQITLISRTNETREIDGLQKNQKILTGIALVCFENYGRKKTPASWGFLRQEELLLSVFSSRSSSSWLSILLWLFFLSWSSLSENTSREQTSN